jgi:nitroreductase
MNTDSDLILNAILNRKSIRKFLPKKVSKENIRKIVMAGQRAPTACRMETYSFILVNDPQTRRKIMDATVSHGSTRKFMMEAPLWFMICVDYARQFRLNETLGVDARFEKMSKLVLGLVDAALAAENMVIAAEALGLGSCFVGSVWTAPKRVAEILNIPKNVFPFLLLCIGYPDETPTIRARWPIEAVLHENVYKYPAKDVVLDHAKTRESWETSSPYRLREGVEKDIIKSLVELGFLHSTIDKE